MLILAPHAGQPRQFHWTTYCVHWASCELLEISHKGGDMYVVSKYPSELSARVNTCAAVFIIRLGFHASMYPLVRHPWQVISTVAYVARQL